MLHDNNIRRFCESGTEAHLAVGLQFDGLGIEEFVGTLDVVGLDALVDLAGEGVRGCCQAIGEGRNDAVVYELMDPAGITEVFRMLGLRGANGFGELTGSIVGELVVVGSQQGLGYLHEFVGGVVLEQELVGEAADESGVHRHEAVHLVLIAGEDDEHVGVLLGEHAEQTLDGATSEVVAIAVTVERVGLVDEEHITLGLLQDLLHVLLRFTDVASDDSSAVDADDLAFGE